MPGPVLGSLVEEKMGRTAETPEQAQRDDEGTDALVIRGEAENWDSARRKLRRISSMHMVTGPEAMSTYKNTGSSL